MLKDVQVLILSSVISGMDNNSSCSFTDITMAAFVIFALMLVDGHLSYITGRLSYVNIRLNYSNGRLSYNDGRVSGMVNSYFMFSFTWPTLHGRVSDIFFSYYLNGH